MVSDSGGNRCPQLALANSGEADESLDISVAVTWNDAELVASDALPGWTVQAERGRAVFFPEPGYRLRLTPGAKQDLGWLRYDRLTTPRWQISRGNQQLR